MTSGKYFASYFDATVLQDLQFGSQSLKESLTIVKRQCISRSKYIPLQGFTVPVKLLQDFLIYSVGRHKEVTVRGKSRNLQNQPCRDFVKIVFLKNVEISLPGGLNFIQMQLKDIKKTLLELVFASILVNYVVVNSSAVETQQRPLKFMKMIDLCLYLFLNNVFYLLKLMLATYRSNRPEMFCKKSVPRNFVKFTGKHLCQSLFFNKIAYPRPETLLKKRIWHRCFPVSFAKFLRTPYLTEHL